MCRSAYVVDVVDVAMPVGGHASCQNACAVPGGGVIRRVAGSGRRASGAGGVRGRGAQVLAPAESFQTGQLPGIAIRQ